MIAAGRGTPEFMKVLGTVYGEMYRNAVLSKDRKGAETIRNQGAQRFINPETKAEEEWWTQLAFGLANWSENTFPQMEKNVVRLREEVKKSPEDPTQIWLLANALAEGVYNLPEARAYYTWLLENHPEFPQVQNGACQYRLAEINYSSREVQTAIKRYLDLQSMHKEHPKVAEPGPTGVKRRLDECYKLSFKMNYARDKK